MIRLTHNTVFDLGEVAKFNGTKTPRFEAALPATHYGMSAKALRRLWLSTFAWTFPI